MSDYSDDWEEWVDQPLPRNVNEIPIVGRYWLLENPDGNRPESELQALMETEPYGTPKLLVNHDDGLTDRDDPGHSDSETDLLGGHWDALSEQEQAVLDCMIVAGHSVRKTAEILGMPKSTVHRIKDSALNILRKRMEQQ